MTTHTPAVVIGAGPYGLSVAAHLSARGSQPRVFGEVMSSWRSHMPAGMCLKSTPDASSLSAAKPGYQLADYCTSQGIRPLQDASDDIIPIELFTRYGQWFQEQLVPQVEQSVVTHVERAGHGFVVTLDTGEEILTPTVVVATGVSHVDYVPDELAALAPGGQPSPDAAVSHTSQHSSLTGFRGQDLRQPDTDTWDAMVVQAVVSYPAADAARAFFSESADRWSKCTNHHVNMTVNDQPQRKLFFGNLTKTDTELSMPVTRGQNERSCQRVLSVVSNIILDVAACNHDATDQAASIAQKIKDRVGH